MLSDCICTIQCGVSHGLCTQLSNVYLSVRDVLWIFSADLHVNWRWQCESEGNRVPSLPRPVNTAAAERPQRQQCSHHQRGFGALRWCWTALQGPPAWNFINLHLSFYPLTPTETPRLAQWSHGTAASNQAPAEIWNSFSAAGAPAKISSNRSLSAKRYERRSTCKINYSKTLVRFAAGLETKWKRSSPLKTSEIFEKKHRTPFIGNCLHASSRVYLSIWSSLNWRDWTRTANVMYFT